MWQSDNHREELYRITFDPSGATTVSTLVVLAACEVTGMDPRDAPPLSAVIDPSSLDSLFARRAGTDTERPPRLRFPYFGHLVVVDGAGWIGIYRVGEEDRVNR